MSFIHPSYYGHFALVLLFYAFKLNIRFQAADVPPVHGLSVVFELSKPLRFSRVAFFTNLVVNLNNN